MQTQFVSGATVYAIVLNAAGQAWRTDSHAFEVPAAADWTHYAISMAEQSTTGVYLGSFPAAIVNSGTFAVLFRQQAGASPAATDQSNGMLGGEIYWTGAAETFPVTPQQLPTGAIVFNVISPILQNGSLTLVRGDDYFNADGRAPTWTAAPGAWPNLTGASISMQGKLSPSNENSGSASYTIAGVVAAAGTGTQTVYVEIPEATTAALAVGAMAYDYALIATLADGHVATLAQGNLTINAQS